MQMPHSPISIQSTTLIVNDLESVSEYYRKVVGLEILRRDKRTCELGVQDTVVLHLQQDFHASQHRGQAGLFHNAFLMPNRTALANWLGHFSGLNIHLSGAADHDASEAIYLNDPEGNGIEIYVDRPRQAWVYHNNGQVKLGNSRLDLHDLIACASGEKYRTPKDMTLGHVHLNVGNIEDFHSFMVGKLKQDLMLDEGSVRFYSTGGYHHHFAGNIWNTSNSGQRDLASAGLAKVTLGTDGTMLGEGQMTDPWGIVFEVVRV